MTEKYLIKHNDIKSYNEITNLLNEKKPVDIVFIDCQLDIEQNIIISSVANNIKILQFKEFSNLATPILLFKINGDNQLNSDIFNKKITEFSKEFKNKIIVRIDESKYCSEVIKHIYKNSNGFFELFCDIISCGLHGDIYFIDDNQINVYNLKNFTNQTEYDFDENNRIIKIEILKFYEQIKNLKSKGNFNYNIKITDEDLINRNNPFNEKNYLIYLYNFFINDDFVIRSQIKNSENFRTIFTEILKICKSNNTYGNQLMKIFLENYFIEISEQSNIANISSLIKKIQIVASSFDKVQEHMQNIFTDSFFKNLSQQKSSALIIFLCINFTENLIMSDSKKKFIKLIIRDEYIINLGIDIDKIFKSEPKINYNPLFDSQNFDYCLPENFVNNFFENTDKEIIKNIILSECPSFNPIRLIFKRKFFNEIIQNSPFYTLNALIKFIEKNFDDIEKNKCRDAILPSIFSDNFIEQNHDKIKILKRFLPISVISKVKEQFPSLI